MNLWLRLLWFLLKAAVSSDHCAPNARRTVSFRVMPWDIDTNGHLTNSRYLSFMDIGRLDLFVYSGLWKRDWTHSTFPILQSVEVSYVRSILPGQVTSVHTQILGVDDKYCYIQQQFTVHGKLVADARVRAVLCNGHGALWPTSIMSQYNIPSSLPASIEQWKKYLSLKTIESREI